MKVQLKAVGLLAERMKAPESEKPATRPFFFKDFFGFLYFFVKFFFFFFGFLIFLGRFFCFFSGFLFFCEGFFLVSYFFGGSFCSFPGVGLGFGG